MITYERQKDGTLKQVDSPPKRAELVEQRIYDRCLVRVGQLEAEKATLEARIDELCAENEKLRQLVDGAANEADRLTHDAAAFQIENAKLRELAVLQSVIFKHMSTCPTTDCQVCPVKEECAKSVHLAGVLGIDDKETSWLVQWRIERRRCTDGV